MKLEKILGSSLTYLSGGNETRVNLLLGQQNLKVDELAFSKWFDGSKVVDENGNPMVVYHGSNSRIEVFDEALFISGQVEATLIRELLDLCGGLRLAHEAPAWKVQIDQAVYRRIAEIKQSDV